MRLFIIFSTKTSEMCYVGQSSMSVVVASVLFATLQSFLPPANASSRLVHIHIINLVAAKSSKINLSHTVLQEKQHL